MLKIWHHPWLCMCKEISLFEFSVHARTNIPDSQDRLHNICLWAHTDPRQIIKSINMGAVQKCLHFPLTGWCLKALWPPSTLRLRERWHVVCKNCKVGGWGTGNPYLVRIVKIVWIIGPSVILASFSKPDDCLPNISSSAQYTDYIISLCIHMGQK